MSLIRNALRTRGALVAIVVIGLVGVTAAVGVASHSSSDQIVFVNNSDGSISIQRGGLTQTADSGPGCRGSLSGPEIITIDAVSEQNRWGLVEDGIGASENRGGNAQSCGRVDYVGGSLGSEVLTFELGSDSEGFAIDYVQWDVEAKFDTEMVVEFLNNGTPIASVTWDPGDTSDEGPDSKFNDKYRVFMAPGYVDGDEPPTDPNILFDGVRVSMNSGGVAIEGGADWQFAPGTSPSEHRTVFHLADVTPAISIDKTTNGQQGSSAGTPLFIPSDTPTPITWTYTVENTGNVSLTNVNVSDDQGEVPVLQTADGNGLLDPGEIWIYEATGTSEDGTYDAASSDPFIGYTNEGRVTAESAVDATATVDEVDSSGYYGTNPSIAIDCTLTEAELPCDGDVVINVGEDVIWNFEITNTGNVPLTAVIVVEDETGGPVPLPEPNTCDTLPDPLLPGQSATCTATETSTEGDEESVFIVQGEDPLGETTSQTSGTVSYTANNPPLPGGPTGVIDSYTVDERDESGPLTFDSSPDSVLDNDTDPDGDLLSASNPMTSAATNGGTVDVLNADGTFEYTPDDTYPWDDDEFSRVDTWTYDLSDGAATAVGTVEITVLRVICSGETVTAEDGEVFGAFTLQAPAGVNPCKHYVVDADDGSEGGEPEVTLALPPQSNTDTVFFTGMIQGLPEVVGTDGTLTIGLTYDRDGDGTLFSHEALEACEGTPILVEDSVTGIVTVSNPSQALIPAGETWCLAGADSRAVDGEIVTVHFAFGSEDPSFRFR